MLVNEQYAVKTLEYYPKDGSHIVFEKYSIDTLGIIKNKKTGKTPTYCNKKYNVCVLSDNAGKMRMIRVARAVASTFLGKPPSPDHTADHIESEQKKNDKLTNIRWLNKSGQCINQIRAKTLKTAFLIVKDGADKTSKEWAALVNAVKTSDEREYTKDTIAHYARKKRHGFSYKDYPDLEGEDWRKIEESESSQGYWKISNLCRVKYVTKHAENVLWDNRLGRNDTGYPIIKIKGKTWMCHVLAFAVFHPEKWKNKKIDEIVLHEDGNKEDFRPHKLRLGTQSDNVSDWHKSRTAILMTQAF